MKTKPDVGTRLWKPGDIVVAQRISDVVTGAPMKLWQLARRLGVTTDGLDRVLQRNPYAFTFVTGLDGIDHVTLRAEAGPEDVHQQVEDMRHFQTVAPSQEPRARAWIRRRPGYCPSCGDPLGNPAATTRCDPCKAATRLIEASEGVYVLQLQDGATSEAAEDVGRRRRTGRGSAMKAGGGVKVSFAIPTGTGRCRARLTS